MQFNCYQGVGNTVGKTVIFYLSKTVLDVVMVFIRYRYNITDFSQYLVTPWVFAN